MDRARQSQVKLGIFDHIDDAGVPLSELYENRLRLAEACDRAGFHGYHIAEHHFTPHGTAPSPSVLLSAMAQRTRSIRIGLLAMILNFYHPLRAYEELCMLDHLSGGRLDCGFGRGASDLELGMYGVDPSTSRERYEEAFDLVMTCMRGGSVDFHGTFFDADNVPLTLSPYQQPHPPLWYGVTRPDGASWAASRNINIVTYGDAARVRGVCDAYRAAWRPAGGAPLPYLGSVVQIVIAETEREAQALAGSAYARWWENFAALPKQFGSPLPPAPETYAAAQQFGLCMAGTEDSIFDQLHERIEKSSVNYVLCHVAMGDLPHTAALATVEALARFPAMANAMQPAAQ